MHHLSLWDPRPTMWFHQHPPSPQGSAYTDKRPKLPFHKPQKKQKRKGGHATRETRPIKCSPGTSITPVFKTGKWLQRTDRTRRSEVETNQPNPTESTHLRI